jgi:hypothetical protein
VQVGSLARQVPATTASGMLAQALRSAACQATKLSRPPEIPGRAGGRSRVGAAPRVVGTVAYGVTLLMRVPQLASAVRVPPQLPTGAANHCASVHVWPMYSAAIQMVLPSATVAP